MRAENLFSEFVLTTRTVGAVGECAKGRNLRLLLIVVLPNRMFIQLSCLFHGVSFVDPLHLQPLLKSCKLIKVFLFKHLSDKEPV